MIDSFAGFRLTSAERERLLVGCHDVRLIESNGDWPDSLREAFFRCQVSFGRCPAAWVQQSPSLRWMQLDSVGFDDLIKLDWATLGKRITVTNLAGFFAEPVAESALAGLLALLRGVDQLVHLRPLRAWKKMEIRPKLRNLAGAKVLLVGYGSIGRRFEELLQAFKCDVKAFSATSGPSTAELDRLLPTADVVFCSVPETSQTKAMFNSDRLGRMKRDAIFINVGRGGVVDESALESLLRSGQLAGAVLDVTIREPLPPEHGLWTCPNVILTQHTGGGTEDEGLRKVDAFIENYRRYRAGELLHGIVDFSRGY